MHIYFDNAATTPVDPLVLEEMVPYLSDRYGNPSSTHAVGREAKSAIEGARKRVAGLLNCQAGEIVFTGSGTEADNAVILGTIRDFGIKHIVTSSIEHHAVLSTAEYARDCGLVELHLVKVNGLGEIDLDDLRTLLKGKEGVLVSLMHANNELGNLNPIEEIRTLCDEAGALFHSDTVQSIGHYKLDLGDPVAPDYMVASAHKFHGPKGAGLLFMRGTHKLKTMMHGGGQERGFRGGTENVAGIMGLAKALELTYEKLEEDTVYITGLKKMLVDGVKEIIPGIEFNGKSEGNDRALYNLVSLSLPENGANQMVLFNLDLKGIALSGGSACSSGAIYGSHVLEALQVDKARGVLRVSFSKFNTEEEVSVFLEALKEMYG